MAQQHILKNCYAQEMTRRYSNQTNLIGGGQRQKNLRKKSNYQHYMVLTEKQTKNGGRGTD